jgi:hypothetical protein
MIGHEKALHEMMQLKPLLTQLVFGELLKAGKIDFIKLSIEYTNWLEGEKKEKEAMISHLTLHLGLCAGQDKSPFSKAGRKFLYDNGLYTGKDGSGFGKLLEDEFGDK